MIAKDNRRNVNYQPIGKIFGNFASDVMEVSYS